MLPGLVVASLLGFSLLLGGALGLLVGAVCIALVGRLPRLDGDVAVSVVITSLFGLGVLLGLAPEVPAGLSDLLFGDVLGVTDADLALTAGLAAAMLALLATVHHSLLAVGFDRLSAPALGRSPARYDVLLALALAAATLVAVQALGNLLVVAMLIGPAASARLLCRRMLPMMLLATSIAVGASVTGLYVSYHAELAAGASVTLALVTAFALAAAGRALAGSRAAGRA
jgi:ABC-type Mn2+/Zn2+ transport system permease subunit